MDPAEFQPCVGNAKEGPEMGLNDDVAGEGDHEYGDHEYGDHGYGDAGESNGIQDAGTVSTANRDIIEAQATALVTGIWTSFQYTSNATDRNSKTVKTRVYPGIPVFNYYWHLKPKESCP